MAARMSLLSICQSAANNIGITAPSSIIGSTDPTAQRLLQMARRTGREMSTRTNWVSMIVERVFYANGSAELQLPPDMRSIIDDTLWDRTHYWRMRGPMTPQQWQLYKSSVIGRATIERRWRIKMPTGGMAGTPALFTIDPSVGSPGFATDGAGNILTDDQGFPLTVDPGVGSQFVLEYVSKNWVKSTTRFQMSDAMIAKHGIGYSIGDIIPLSGGVVGATPASIYVTQIYEPTGGIITAEITTPGVFPSVPGGLTLLPDSGPGPSANWATFYNNSQTFTGLTSDDWMADTDTALMDEDLIELGVIWRMMHRLGLSYDEEKSEYMNQLGQAVARDGGTAILNLVPYPSLSLVGPWNVQESNFPGTVA
jgi:hypothetical protein